MLDPSFEYLRPFDEPDLIRLGKKGDGGYIISQKSLDKDICLLTFGMSDEWSFEEEFTKQNQKNFVHIYDHTVDLNFFVIRFYKSIKRLLYFKSNFSFIFEKGKKLFKYLMLHKVNITHYKFKINDHKSSFSKDLKTTISDTNHDGKIMLKVDIEGDELKVLKDINLFSEKIHTLIIEFHLSDENLLEFENLIKEINKKFYIIHIHGNNHLNYIKQGLPKALEITFLNNKMFFRNNKKTKFHFPIENLDFPNNENEKDIQINFNTR